MRGDFLFPHFSQTSALAPCWPGLVFKSQSFHSPAVGLGAKDLTSPGLRFLPVKWEEEGSPPHRLFHVALALSFLTSLFPPHVSCVSRPSQPGFTDLDLSREGSNLLKWVGLLATTAGFFHLHFKNIFPYCRLAATSWKGRPLSCATPPPPPCPHSLTLAAGFRDKVEIIRGALGQEEPQELPEAAGLCLGVA